MTEVFQEKNENKKKESDSGPVSFIPKNKSVIPKNEEVKEALPDLDMAYSSITPEETENNSKKFIEGWLTTRNPIYEKNVKIASVRPDSTSPVSEHFGYYDSQIRPDINNQISDMKNTPYALVTSIIDEEDPDAKGQYDGHNILYLEDSYIPSYSVHERTHSLNPRIQEAAISKKLSLDVIKQREKAKYNEQWRLDYIDYFTNPIEIYANLMDLRYSEKLDPKHFYTIDEINAIREKVKSEDPHVNQPRNMLFEFFTDEELQVLFNEIAMNLPSKSSDMLSDDVKNLA